MDLRTFSQIKTKLSADYDITDEVFVDDDELVGYINEAIDDAETAIHNLHHEQKYFLVPTTVTLVNGTQDYALPANIYSNKIRLLYFNDGTKKYKLKPLRNLEKMIFVDSSDASDYEYLLINVEGTGPRLRLHRSASESGAYLYLWYIRNMLRMTTSTASTNICELPECANFVYQHVRKSLAKKTRNPVLIAQEDADLKIQYSLMLETLKDMTIDEETKIPLDLEHYRHDMIG